MTAYLEQHLSQLQMTISLGCQRELKGLQKLTWVLFKMLSKAKWGSILRIQGYAMFKTTLLVIALLMQVWMSLLL
jgi:hypothetical protein